MPAPHTQRDYFAELYVAGIFGDAGWAVYFPKRDVGFDFVISKLVAGSVLLRPVQVKGLYPTAAKKDNTAYGFRGSLSAVHPEMVLVLPYFGAHERGAAPEVIAYMPLPKAGREPGHVFACRPAEFIGGHPAPRQKFRQFFGGDGLAALELPSWSNGRE